MAPNWVLAPSIEGFLLKLLSVGLGGYYNGAGMLVAPLCECQMGSHSSTASHGGRCVER